MTAVPSFSLRPLERNTPHEALEGAFRAHLSPKDLKSLGVVNGEAIRITSTSTGIQGFAVAWNAASTNPGSKLIVKVTDLLREKYGLHLQESVIIEKAAHSWKPIESIQIKMVKSEDKNKFKSTEELLHWARYALGMLSPTCALLTPASDRITSGSGLDLSWMHL
jgi:AAA family ATPase